MDVLVLIDKLDDLIHNVRPVTLTDQVRVDREEIYDLLDQMRAQIPGLRPAVLDDELYVSLMELKGFRHRVRHNHGFDLDAGRTEQNRALMQATFPKLVEAVRTLENRPTGSGADDPAERP